MGATLTSITGLQNLTNLQDFRADWNSLTSIDISGLSNLQIVDISDNNTIDGDNTNSLASVNLTGCTNIAQLRLDGGNFTTGNNIAVNLDGSGVANGELSLSGGTNAVPSGSGRDALVNLSGKGWIIDTNNAPGLTQRNNWYDATDTGSVCNHTAGFNTFYASGSLGIGTVAYAENWGGTPTAEGWYQPNDDIDFTLYFVSGGVITTTASCP